MTDLADYTPFADASLYVQLPRTSYAPIQTVDRKTARAVFKSLIASLDIRLRELEQLISTDLPNFQLRYDYECLDVVESWYHENVFEAMRDEEWLSPEWASVAVDVGLLQSAILHAKVPVAKWKLETRIGKNLVIYHFPILEVAKSGPEGNRFVSSYVWDVIWATLVMFIGSTRRRDVMRWPQLSMSERVERHVAIYRGTD